MLERLNFWTQRKLRRTHIWHAGLSSEIRTITPSFWGSASRPGEGGYTMEGAMPNRGAVLRGSMQSFRWGRKSCRPICDAVNSLPGPGKSKRKKNNCPNPSKEAERVMFFIYLCSPDLLLKPRPRVPQSLRLRDSAAPVYLGCTLDLEVVAYQTRKKHMPPWTWSSW